MKKLMMIGIACCAINNLFAQQDAYLIKSLSNEVVKKVEAITSGGNISVTGVPSGESRIEVYAKLNGKNNGSNASKEEIKK